MQFRWQSFKKIVRLWVDLFDRHNLLTYASAIALRTFIAAVACTLFSLGLLGAAHERRLWKDTIAPQIEPKVLPRVFDGIDQTVQRVFGSSSAGLPRMPFGNTIPIRPPGLSHCRQRSIKRISGATLLFHCLLFGSIEIR